MKKTLIYKIILLILVCFPLTNVLAYRRATTKEYKEFLRKFLEEKYYLNKDGDSESESTCEVSKIDASCPGVTVSGKTYDLETYVAGVLYAEPGATIDGNEELGKAWAILIRSYTLAHTNNCKNSISNSSNEQNFSSSNLETYKKYADATAGIVMTENGEIVEAIYSLANESDCIIVDGKCKFKRCTKYAESVRTCPGKVTEFIVPTGTITYTGSDIHYGGIEPYIARYLANKENYTYEQILKAFYGDITISKISGSVSESKDKKSSGTVSCNNDTGDMVSVDNVSFPIKYYDNLTGNTPISELKNNKYYSSYAGTKIGQCTWYAKGRAMEIINSSNVSSDIKEKATAIFKQLLVNGKDMYGGVNDTLGSFFAYSSDINKPKAGSIIAWTGGNGHDYGHAAIIEKVNNDGTVVLSEGWNSGGPNGSDSWDNVVVRTITVNISDLEDFTGHKFEGYTYLFSYRK